MISYSDGRKEKMLHCYFAKAWLPIIRMGGYFEKQIRKEMIMQLQIPEGPILKDFIKKNIFILLF